MYIHIYVYIYIYIVYRTRCDYASSCEAASSRPSRRSPAARIYEYESKCNNYELMHMNIHVYMCVYIYIYI